MDLRRCLAGHVDHGRCVISLFHILMPLISCFPSAYINLQDPNKTARLQSLLEGPKFLVYEMASNGIKISEDAFKVYSGPPVTVIHVA